MRMSAAPAAAVNNIPDDLSFASVRERCELVFFFSSRRRHTRSTRDWSSDVCSSDLQAGHGIVSLLLNPQGHILAEIETYAFPDRLLCVSYSMIRERLIEVLDKYIIMDDVTLTDETPRYGTLALEGPKAAALVKEVSRADLTAFEELSSHGGKVGSIPCWITKRS